MRSAAVSQAQLDAAGRVQAVVLGRLNTLHKARAGAEAAASSADPGPDARPDAGADPSPGASLDVGAAAGSGARSGGESVDFADQGGGLKGPAPSPVFRGPGKDDPDSPARLRAQPEGPA
jgi:hypothetical protein